MMVAAVSKKVYISWNTFPATSGSANLIRIGELVEPSVNGPFDFALRLTLRGPAILFCYIGFSV